MADLSTVFWCPNCDQEAPAATLGSTGEIHDLCCIFCGCPDVIEESELVGGDDAVT